jgi:hypothetical protein
MEVWTRLIWIRIGTDKPSGFIKFGEFDYLKNC